MKFARIVFVFFLLLTFSVSEPLAYANTEATSNNTNTNTSTNNNSAKNDNTSENATANPSDKNFEFPDYLVKEANEQVTAFQKETGSLTTEEIHKAESRAKEAFVRQDWIVATNEYSRVLGKHPERRDIWIRLSIAAHNKNIQERNYVTEAVAKKAAIAAYTLAKSPDEQAEAILVYGNTFNPSDDYDYPYYQYALDYASYLSDITKLKQSNKDLLNVMDFRYLQPRVNTDSSPQCLFFIFPPHRYKRHQYHGLCQY